MRPKRSWTESLPTSRGTRRPILIPRRLVWRKTKELIRGPIGFVVASQSAVVSQALAHAISARSSRSCQRTRFFSHLTGKTMCITTALGPISSRASTATHRNSMLQLRVRFPCPTVLDPTLVLWPLNIELFLPGNLHVIRIPQGSIGLATDNGHPELLAPGHRCLNWTLTLTPTLNPNWILSFALVLRVTLTRS